MYFSLLCLDQIGFQKYYDQVLVLAVDPHWQQNKGQPSSLQLRWDPHPHPTPVRFFFSQTIPSNPASGIFLAWGSFTPLVCLKVIIMQSPERNCCLVWVRCTVRNVTICKPVCASVFSSISSIARTAVNKYIRQTPSTTGGTQELLCKSKLNTISVCVSSENLHFPSNLTYISITCVCICTCVWVYMCECVSVHPSVCAQCVFKVCPRVCGYTVPVPVSVEARSPAELNLINC